eukprot:CAMPEP_0183360286 /NCGR_PEP_ID=MMETSP0164_2-20130417/54813_1 /TAXON_ID=221442 /ORGANISM="Coccolithus pelagicus ssp braarudi, Strain PLY182g" /LENGTH=40 /DNA_ID= /DNA_START= /DNA_END= /DNA_ORIENTATION=
MTRPLEPAEVSGIGYKPMSQFRTRHPGPCPSFVHPFISIG